MCHNRELETRNSQLGSCPWYALALLLSVNLLNYVDRQVLYAVFPLIKKDLTLSDTALGLLGSAFMFFYMCSAPLLGWLANRVSQVKLASAGLCLWSFATALSGLAGGYNTLLFARTVVGVGEAGFGTVSPGLISDFFPKECRGRILSYFYLAIPVGSAFGYIFGGILGQNFGWHAAFFMVGIPGLVLTIPLYRLKAPPCNSASRPAGAKSSWNAYSRLFKNRSFITNTLTMAAMTFALGGLAQWIPTFFHRIHGLDVSRANTLFGVITVLSGITGTLTGGLLGDRLQKKNRKGYLLVSGWGLLIGAPIAAFSLITTNISVSLTAVFLAEFFLFLNTGPLNTVIVAVTTPNIRAMAFAVNIFFIHALGDAISPTILGYLSDLWGLRTALLLTPVAILLAGCLSLVCTGFISADIDRAEMRNEQDCFDPVNSL